MRSLGELLDGLVEDRVLGPHRKKTISGVFDDSRRAQADGVFVAVRGHVADGRRYVGEAVRRGASVLVGEGIEPVADVVVLNVRDARAALAEMASRWYGLRQQGGLELLGVTGTNGKSTTVYMTSAILRAAGRKCGMLGTVQYDLGARSVSSDMTTPGPLELAAYLRECADGGCDAVALEVSSHALSQKRTDGLRFAAAAFTNLTRDHLDYHGTPVEYAAAKARLFDRLDPSAVAVINADAPGHARMLEHCSARVLKYSLKGAADITARVSHETTAGTIYEMSLDGRSVGLENALVGSHNVYNALAAAGLACAVGAPLAAIAEGLRAVRNIPGRLQRVPCAAGVEVFVDYAHTDDALRNVLSVLKPLARRRLIVVFGCGGDRDRTKRPLMAQAAAEFGDAVVVTSDNPRTEAPQGIIDDILEGFDADARRRVVVEPDRREAIRAALAGADEGDVVLIAGKGHEDYQILGTQRVHFDDVEVAIEAAGTCGRGPVVGFQT